jgi:dihydropteroate synthase
MGMDKDTLFYKKRTIACNGKIIDIGSPIVMGILNVTPDSFYDGGKYQDKNKIISRVHQIIDEGATIIDAGGFSSRPGALEITEKEEIKRLSFALEIIREKYPLSVISVDTFRAKVAAEVIEKYRIDIINDISGGNIEPEILDVVASAGIPYISMHMLGMPRTMQKNPVYKHVVKDILQYFVKHISVMRDKGIHDIIIDPGFGFGKTIEHNYQLLGGLEVFQMLELPVLVGLSRKSMIYKFLDTSPHEALTGTIALNLVALQKGASILRVHDVREAIETIRIYKKLEDETEKSVNLLMEN